MAKPLQRFFVNELNDVEMKGIGACALSLEQFFYTLFTFKYPLNRRLCNLPYFLLPKYFFFLGKEQPNFLMETENKPSHVALLTGVTANYLFG